MHVNYSLNIRVNGEFPVCRHWRIILNPMWINGVDKASHKGRVIDILTPHS